MSLKQRERVWMVAAGVALLLLAGRPGHSHAADPRIERILADWKQRQKAMRTARYHLTGTDTTPKGSSIDATINKPFVPPSPPQDVITPREFVLVIDFQGKRWREEEKSEGWIPTEGRLRSNLGITVRTDKTRKSAIPREANSTPDHPRAALDPDMIVTHPSTAEGELPPGVAWFLTGHGIIAGALFSKVDFDQTFDVHDFRVHGQAVYQGRPCLVVRNRPQSTMGQPTYDEYWIDAERGSAVLRHLTTYSGGVTQDVDMTCQHTPYGWLPDHWTFTDYGPGGRIWNVMDLQLAEWSADPAVTDSDFDVPIEPGMIVMEGKAGVPPRFFRVVSGGHWNEIIDGVEQKGGSRLTYWLASLLLAAVTLLVTAYGWRRWRRARPLRQPL